MSVTTTTTTTAAATGNAAASQGESFLKENAFCNIRRFLIFFSSKI